MRMTISLLIFTIRVYSESITQAGRHGEAAKLLTQLGKQAGESKLNPLRAKKLYVLAAMEAEAHRRSLFEPKNGAGGSSSGATANSTAAMLQSLLDHDKSTGELPRVVFSWRLTAEATSIHCSQSVN